MESQSLLSKKGMNITAASSFPYFIALESYVKIYSSNLSNLWDGIYHLLRWVWQPEETTTCFMTGSILKNKKKIKEKKRRTSSWLTVNKDVQGSGFFLCYWSCEFSPWKCYLVHESWWFFSPAAWMPSDFFVQSLTDTMATTTGTKQVFVIDDGGFFLLRSSAYCNLSVRYSVPELLHFTIPDTGSYLRIICQLKRRIP